jgi:hypothetical protein
MLLNSIGTGMRRLLAPNVQRIQELAGHCIRSSTMWLALQESRRLRAKAHIEDLKPLSLTEKAFGLFEQVSSHQKALRLINL